MGRTPAGQTRGKVFRFVRERLLAGRPPTTREVQEAFGFRSVQTAREHLEALVGEGQLSKQQGQARGYRLPLEFAPPRLIPLLGRVPAGPFDMAIEDLEDYIPVPSDYGDADDLFGLRVHGESMSGAGILSGDVVVVRRQPNANNGEIVVALVGDEATVKRLRLRRGRAELQPENPAFETIVPDPRELRLLGKVIEVRRYLDR